MQTKDQEMARKAYGCVSKRKEDGFDEYARFALSFPSLIHSCGLVQAIAFAKSKGRGEYLADLEAVFNAVFNTADPPYKLEENSRNAELAEYTRISRHALAAASWIKRYCQGMN